MKAFVFWLRNAWVMAGITVVMVVLADGLLKASLPEYADSRLVRPGATAPPQRAAEFYADTPWADGYFSEHRQARFMRWEPYVYWRRQPFTGTTINIDARGHRLTWNSQEGEGGLRIFVFGGSSVWGTGARDDYTIPSVIAKLLAERGIAATVTNYGESGYVSGQEVVALWRELQGGNVPDFAIFYDGVNDVFSALQSGQAGVPQNEGERRRDFRATNGLDNWLAALPYALEGVLRLTRWLSPPADPTSVDALAERVVSAYRENVRTVRALGREYGFQAAFFWQPSVFGKRRPSLGEQAVVDASLAVHRDLQIAADRVLRDTAGQDPAVVDLSALFDTVEQPLYMDFSHLSEEGNRLAARAIVDALADRLESSPGKSPGKS